MYRKIDIAVVTALVLGTSLIVGALTTAPALARAHRHHHHVSVSETQRDAIPDYLRNLKPGDIPFAPF